MMASMRNGSGDDYLILFNPAGAVIKGLAHEYPMTGYEAGGWPLGPGIYDRVPDEFAEILTEPAFSPEMVSFCIWLLHTDRSWRIGEIESPVGDDPDGSRELLAIFDGLPQTYQCWSADYYEQPIPLAAVERIYRHEPLTNGLILALNPEIRLADLREDIANIAYPAAPIGAP